MAQTPAQVLSLTIFPAGGATASAQCGSYDYFDEEVNGNYDKVLQLFRDTEKQDAFAVFRNPAGFIVQ